MCFLITFKFVRWTKQYWAMHVAWQENQSLQGRRFNLLATRINWHSILWIYIRQVARIRIIKKHCGPKLLGLTTIKCISLKQSKIQTSTDKSHCGCKMAYFIQVRLWITHFVSHWACFHTSNNWQVIWKLPRDLIWSSIIWIWIPSKTRTVFNS